LGKALTASLFDGHVDGIDELGHVFGWASTHAPGIPARLLLRVDGKNVREIVADQFREDLVHGGLPNPACAFWFLIPDELRDGKRHKAELFLAASGEPLRNSPHEFCLGEYAPPVASRRDNLVPNAGFAEWPSGLRVAVTKAFTEFCSGWFLDPSRGSVVPSILCSVDRAHDLALRPDAYALRITVEQAPDRAYQRIIVPLGIDPAGLGDLRLSLGVRRPPHAEPGALHVREIFMGTAIGHRVRKISTIRKMLNAQGTQRILGIPVSRPGADVALEEGEQVALVIDLAGEGTVMLFSPELGPAPPLLREANAAVGEFEDGYIQDQVSFLKLGTIWSAAAAAVPGAIGQEPRPALPVRSTRGHHGVPFVQIIVPVFNAAVHVEELLRSIQACTPSPHEVLVFDDGSDDFTRERIARWEAIDPRIRYHRHPENLGYTRNVNVAMQSTVAEHVVLINSDTIVTDGWLTRLYQALSVDDRTAAAGPLSNAASWQSIPRTRTPGGEWMLNLFPNGVTPEDVAILVDRLSTAHYPEFPLLNGFCTLFRRSALEVAGFYDDEAFPEGYGEENDLCLRLGRLGYRLRVADDAYVHHKKSVSFGNTRRKALSRRANQILRSKHPEAKIAELEERMRTEPSIIALRHRLLAALGVEPGAD
jgi:GT2 family glycosyltransferase